MNPTYPLVPIANFISSFLAVLVVFSQPHQSWNKGVIYLSIWISILCLITGIETIIWRDSADTTISPVFFDIVIRIRVGTTTSVPVCALIICRCLHDMVRYQVVGTLDSRKHRRETILDLLLVVGLPIITNIFFYVVQPYRFMVIEELGCGAPAVMSGLTILLLCGPPLIVSLVSFVYMGITIALIVRHRRSMNRLLGHQMTMSLSLYLRLLVFGFILLLVSGAAFGNLFPLPTSFYPGWSVVHTDWAPRAVSSAKWHADGPHTAYTIAWNGWINVWLSIATFGLFGLTHDARAAYMRALRSMANWPKKIHLHRSRAVALNLPRTHQDGTIKLSKFRCASSLDCTLPAPPPTAVVLPTSTDSGAIEVAVTVERYADGDLETLAGSGLGMKEKEKV